MLNNKPHNSLGTAKRDNEIECTLNNAIYLQFIFTFDKSIKKFSENEHMMQHIILEEKFIWITVRIEGGSCKCQYVELNAIATRSAQHNQEEYQCNTLVYQFI